MGLRRPSHAVRPLVVGALVLTTAGCLDFDAKLAQCDGGDGRDLCGPRDDGGASVDDGGAGGGTGGATGGGTGGATGGGTGGATGGGTGGAIAGDGGVGECPGFERKGWCWLNPLPFGGDVSAAQLITDDDWWVAGGGGLLAHWNGRVWQDVSFEEGLVDPTGTNGKIKFVRPFDGGVYVGGSFSGIHRLTPSDGGWVRSLVNGTDSDWFNDLVTTSDGRWRAGPSGPAPGEVSFSGGPNGGGLDPVIPNVGEITALGRAADGSIWAGVTMTDASHAIVAPDGGAITLPGFSGVYETVTAVWSSPGSPVVMWAGALGFYGAVNAATATASFTKQDVLHGYPRFTAGTWNAALGQHVLAGSSMSLYVGTESALLGGTLPTQKHPTNVPAYTSAPSLGPIVTLSDGGALVYADGNGRLTWDGTSVEWAGSPLYANLTKLLPAADGVVGAGSYGVTLRANTSIDVKNPGTLCLADVNAVLQDGADLLIATEKGEICRVEPGGTGSELAPSQVALRAFARLQDGGLLAVGNEGQAFDRDGTSWTPHPLAPLPDGGLVDYTGAVAWDGGLLLSADGVAPSTSGLLFLPAGSATPAVVATMPGPVTGLSASPSGRLWVTAWDGLHSFDGLAGLSPKLVATSLNFDNAGMNAVWARSDDDVWVATASGPILHYSKRLNAFTLEETGMRVDLRAITWSPWPGGNGSVWLSGVRGALLRRRLP